ncbi:S41 family peptidase [Niallia taxi]|uniref:C-terminal processing peptidase n=1 Tax=Niallia taxi TaxID=2499688 RepID=A0A437KCE5_9BACI|nr:S41 family peptidase [Niallia taxi]MCM3216260.1 S41 family peptidase [Niallia taxi]MED4037156.1 S41 family peptidase [Niallia taxi]MED4054957.1 S41 family peptidase [Niallia taxi]MED4121031.1 S41 family peptidase [Niallia taxi]RVT63716.1 PDZ domain-containing protein [Niallia taxi]
MNRKLLVICMTGSLIVGAGGTYIGMNKWGEHSETAANSSETVLSKVGKAYDLILNNYVEKVDRDKLEEGAIKGMLSTLEDPYSVYMDKDSAKQFEQALDSSFEGIGAEISAEDGKVIIVSPIKNSPAEKAGIKANDEIVKVDGESVEGSDLYDVTQTIRGEKGTKVKLEIVRQGLEKPLQIAVVRDEVPQITVHSSIKREGGENIGYIEITSFSEDTASEFHKALAAQEQEGIAGLILDVRGNPGGLLTSVNAILEEFVTSDKPYVQIEHRNGKTEQFYSDLKQKKDYPVVVLVDNGSASASEIMAGALKEAENYTLIGEKTFGKGTVQQAVPMEDGSKIKLTLFKWLTPDGNWIHKQGVEPNLEVEKTALYNTHPLQIENTLKREMNNEQVKYAQEILTSIGYRTDRQDGYYSSQTEIAVKAFQGSNNLPETGAIDSNTAEKMQQVVREEMQKDENDIQLQTALHYIVN